MLKDTYVIMTLPVKRSGNLGVAGADPDAVPNIEVTELSQPEVHELQRDRQKRVAPTMPWTLIEPVATEEADIAAEGSVSWGIDAVRASDSPFDGSGIVVAVLDTGIDLDHPVFAGVSIEMGAILPLKLMMISTVMGPIVLERFSARISYGTRIGVAPNIERALIGKVLGKGSSTKGLVDAINWAVSEGAHVISMSLGIDFPGYVADLINLDGVDPEPATSLALEAYRKNVNLFTDQCEFVLSQRVFGEGIVFVAASGNELDVPSMKSPHHHRLQQKILYLLLH